MHVAHPDDKLCHNLIEGPAGPGPCQDVTLGVEDIQWKSLKESLL